MKKTCYRGKIMAIGGSRDGAAQDQIDATVKDAIDQVRSRLSEG